VTAPYTDAAAIAAIRAAYFDVRGPVLHGVQGTCALDVDGVSKDDALEYAADFVIAVADALRIDQR
jgi:hypothetical protein